MSEEATIRDLLQPGMNHAFAGTGLRPDLAVNGKGDIETEIGGAPHVVVTHGEIVSGDYKTLFASRARTLAATALP